MARYGHLTSGIEHATRSITKPRAAIVDQLTLRGFEALVLENSLLRTTILPEMGSDIVELRYKPLDLDLSRARQMLWTLEKVYPTDLASRTSFLDYYPGGWQEILPNGGNASQHAGASFVEHGEVSLLPWSWQLVADEPDRVAVKLTARTLRAPLLIERPSPGHAGRAADRRDAHQPGRCALQPDVGPPPGFRRALPRWRLRDRCAALPGPGASG